MATSRSVAWRQTDRSQCVQVTPSFPQGVQSVVEYGKSSGKLKHKASPLRSALPDCTAMAKHSPLGLLGPFCTSQVGCYCCAFTGGWKAEGVHASLHGLQGAGSSHSPSDAVLIFLTSCAKTSSICAGSHQLRIRRDPPREAEAPETGAHLLLPLRRPGLPGPVVPRAELHHAAGDGAPRVPLQARRHRRHRADL